LEGAVHLTTLMCPRHRQAVLSDVRTRLKGGLPVRLVSTSLIEAGVDISFPEVWRATTGLDSIAQAAGRCSWRGNCALGRKQARCDAIGRGLSSGVRKSTRMRIGTAKSESRNFEKSSLQA
jgi:hypothetical protein